MILILAVVLGVAASAIRHRGQAIHQITSIPLHWAWLALLALALQVPLLRAPSGLPGQVDHQKVLFLSSQLLLLAFVWRNRRLTGMQIVGLGVLCNLVVIVANGGFMPIAPETLVRINPGSSLGQWPAGLHYGHSKDLILLRMDTVLWGLSDRLVLPPPFPWPTAFSPGDLLIAAGIVVLLQGPVTLPRPILASALQAHGQSGRMTSERQKEITIDETQKLEPTAVCRHREYPVS
jgi:hypothetical protein